MRQRVASQSSCLHNFEATTEALEAPSAECQELKEKLMRAPMFAGSRKLPKVEHSRRASKTSSKVSRGSALDTIKRCKQITPLPANLGFRVPQASKKGLTNVGRHFKSLSKSERRTQEGGESDLLQFVPLMCGEAL